MVDVITELKALKLYGMAGCYADILAQDTQAAIQSSEWLIRELVRAEGTDRATRSISYQMHAARFPIHRDLRSFDFEDARVDRALIDKLADLSFTDAAHNVVLIGGTGTGKSHLATALGVKAIQNHGKRVRFYSTVELANTLEQEKLAGRQGKLAYRLIDERGLGDPGRAGLSAVLAGCGGTVVPPAVEAVRAHQRDHHD